MEFLTAKLILMVLKRSLRLLLTSYSFLFKSVRELKVRHENNHFGW